MEARKRVFGSKNQELNLEPAVGTMTGKALKTSSTAVLERITGEGPGRMRAVAASVIAGGMTYRRLRSSGAD